MTFEKIRVGYWHLRKLVNLEYEHQQEFNYTDEKRNEIVNDILSKGYSVMLRPTPAYEGAEDTLMIWIDNGRFGQR